MMHAVFVASVRVKMLSINVKVHCDRCSEIARRAAWIFAPNAQRYIQHLYVSNRPFYTSYRLIVAL